MTVADDVKRLAPRVWSDWTGNPLGMDTEDVANTLRAVLDALRATHRDGIGDDEWMGAALERLRAVGDQTTRLGRPIG